MSVARGYGINGMHYFTNVCKPIDCNLNFVVDSTNGNGLGLRSLKSNGFVESAVMYSTAGAPVGSPNLGSARGFAVLGATAVTSSDGSTGTILTGNLGIYPGTSITGFPPATYSGSLNVANVAAQNAQASANAAYIAMQAKTATGIASELGGQTLAAGTYIATSGTAGTFTLNTTPLVLSGSATDIYIFQTTTTLITGGTGTPTITLGNVLPSNIYWVVGSSATLNSAHGGTFYGNVIALTSITVTDAGTVDGSLIALNGAVTLTPATVVNAQALSTGSASPAPGYLWVKFKNNFNKYLGGFSGFVSPLIATNIAIDSTLLTVGQAYVIVSTGTSTLSDWLAVGLPAGFTPTVGQSFIATKSGNGAGSGLVRAPSVSGVNSIEVVGDPNQTISNSNLAANAGAMVLVQFLSNNVLTAPTDGSVCGMCFRFDGSSVTVDGI